MKLRTAILSVLLTGSIFGIGVVLFLLIRQASVDELGEADGNCIYQDLGSAPNGTGLVATAHETACTYGLVHAGETAYVYVHKAGDSDRGKSLVFLFGESKSGGPPQVVWRDSLTLQISVSRVGEVLKQRNSMGAVKISYSIGEEEIPRGESAKLRRRSLSILSALLISLSAICLVTARLIRRQRNKAS